MKILIDKNVNLKKFEEFVKENSIDCEKWTLRGENKVKKIKRKATGLLILGGPTGLGNRLCKNDACFEEIKKVIGKQNIGDVLHVESAVFNNCDILITEDRDILSKRKELKKLSEKPKIVDFEEFKILCKK